MIILFFLFHRWLIDPDILILYIYVNFKCLDILIIAQQLEINLKDSFTIRTMS